MCSSFELNRQTLHGASLARVLLRLVTEGGWQSEMQWYPHSLVAWPISTRLLRESAEAAHLPCLAGPLLRRPFRRCFCRHVQVYDLF